MGFHKKHTYTGVLVFFFSRCCFEQIFRTRILSEVSLVGRSFERLIVAEDRKRFSDFMKSSINAASKSANAGTPSCSLASDCVHFFWSCFLHSISLSFYIYNTIYNDSMCMYIHIHILAGVKKSWRPLPSAPNKVYASC